MPTYEYRCLNCQREFETFQSIQDELLTTCEQCQGKLQRLIGRNVGIAFKGSGFYATDSKKSSVDSGHAKKSSAKPTK